MQSKKVAWKLPKKAKLQPPGEQDVQTKQALLLVSAIFVSQSRVSLNVLRWNIQHIA